MLRPSQSILAPRPFDCTTHQPTATGQQTRVIHSGKEVVRKIKFSFLINYEVLRGMHDVSLAIVTMIILFQER